ncbi:MAG: DmsE family decaheme c-type cytochrome [Magnetospirillum sp.]|nr:DmsE family decaheme c-type cytochrome [Magnetospirillum sp.]
MLKGDAVCTKCHDEQDNYPILKIGQTKHGTVADGRTPTCTSCHGESATHVNKPADAAERPKPDRLFRKTSPTPVDERNAACLSCHEGGQHILWAGSTHQSRGVACTDCHQVHNGKDKVRDKQTQPEVCFNCHKQQRAQIEKPSHHPIPEGEMACSDCHAPHGSAGPKLMKRDTVNDTCFQCHAEKRGPHLWSHQPVTENCALCHNPHGTTTPNMLKQRAPFLCQECHEPTSHRGGIPSLSGSSGGTSGLGITGGRACLNCHTNIHGGNNPTNNGASRSMRR